MNILIRELKANKKSSITWIIILSSLIILFLTLFPAFTKDTFSTQKILENFPEAVRQALGISIKDFFTINGFVSYLFTFIGIAGAIQAMNLGLGLISKEHSLKTVDFLLVKPISRVKILTQKILSGLIIILATNIIFSLTALISANIITSSNFNQVAFILITLTMFFIQLFFFSIGILISTVVGKIKSVVSISMPTAFMFFIIGTLGSIIGDDKIRYISPFKYFDSNYIIQHESYELKFLFIELITIALAIGFSYFVYKKKDIKSNN